MKSFIWRKYVSIGLALSFVMISLSGIVLYIAPAGSIARWIKWIMIGFERAQWETIHTIFSFLFIIFGVIHLFNLNWKAFLSYFINGVNSYARSRKEAVAAVLTIALVFIFTVYKLPPFYSVMELGNRISDSWSEKVGKPPVAGLEDMTLAEISDIFYASDLKQVEHLVKSAGFVIPSGNKTLREIAEANRVSPLEIFRSLKTGINDSYSR